MSPMIIKASAITSGFQIINTTITHRDTQILQISTRITTLHPWSVHSSRLQTCNSRACEIQISISIQQLKNNYPWLRLRLRNTSFISNVLWTQFYQILSNTAALSNALKTRQHYQMLSRTTALLNALKTRQHYQMLSKHGSIIKCSQNTAALSNAL